MGIARALKDVFVVSAKRTPFGSYGGKLVKHSATELHEITIRAALTSANVNPELVDSVHVGNVFQSTGDGGYISRCSALKAGIPETVPALTVNRLCGSGFQSVLSACQEIELGDSEICVSGGTENMSMAPHVAMGYRFGVPLGKNIVLQDSLWNGLTDPYYKIPMGMTGENVAEKYNVSRKDSDEQALTSQTRYKAALDAGYFNEEIAPVTLQTKKGEVKMDCDEHPRSVTAESLAKLPPVFKKDGTVTAGNASGICDGAGTIILASGEACKKHNLKPLARLAGYSIAGVDPKIMGIGPVPAVQDLLAKTGKGVNDIDLVEMNEAFASQMLVVQRELGFDPDKVNIDGGAIAIGHPVSATGIRITAHLIYALKRKGLRYGISSGCVGGGQGMAFLLENMSWDVHKRLYKNWFILYNLVIPVIIIHLLHGRGQQSSNRKARIEGVGSMAKQYGSTSHFWGENVESTHPWDDYSYHSEVHYTLSRTYPVILLIHATCAKFCEFIDNIKCK